MTKYLLLPVILLLHLGVAAQSAGELSSEQFLDLLRRPRGVETWGKLSGRIEHVRSDGKKLSAPVYMAMMFTQQQIYSQVVVDNRQGYFIGQTFEGTDAGTSVLPMHKSNSGDELLGEYGLRPEDLTMSFIYWDFVEELPRETISMRECRVFLLRKEHELVRLSVNTEFLFPMRASWYKDKYDPQQPPYRNLEATKFKEVRKLWLVTRLQLNGPGWRTRIDFTETEAGLREGGTPADLFIKELPKGK